MSNNFKNQQKRYYRDIKRYLSGKPDAKQYSRSLKANIDSFAREHDVADITELYAQFGTAEEVAEAYLGETSRLDYSKRVQRLKAFCLTACILVLLLVTFFFCFLHVLRERPLKETEIRIERRME